MGNSDTFSVTGSLRRYYAVYFWYVGGGDLESMSNLPNATEKEVYRTEKICSI